MTIQRILTGTMLFCMSLTAAAELVPYKDYDVGESLTNVTTIKVDSNRIDDYLEGLRATWMTGNEAAKALGQIEDYAIYVSQLPSSGDFNVILTITMKSAADMQPSKAKYNAFMKKWGEDNKANTDKITPSYPGIREITGEYLVRKITMK